MSTTTNEQLATAIAKAVAEVLQTLTVDPTEQVQGVHRNAAGRLVDANGRYVAEPKAKKVAKKATARKTTSKKVAKKAEPKAIFLTKAHRRDFIAALKAEFGVDLTGSTTKEVAAYAIENDAIPAGFAVGKGYREVVANL